MNHVHTCPKCFEQGECTDDCEIEPDLGWSNKGLPKATPVECPACTIVWTLSDALELCGVIEKVISKIGFHVGLRGGVLMRGKSDHDLDLIIYPHDSTVCRAKLLYDELRVMGLDRQKTVAECHAGWRLRGSSDKKNVEIWTTGERVIDIFYAGFDPYPGEIKSEIKPAVKGKRGS